MTREPGFTMLSYGVAKLFQVRAAMLVSIVYSKINQVQFSLGDLLSSDTANLERSQFLQVLAQMKHAVEALPHKHGVNRWHAD